MRVTLVRPIDTLGAIYFQILQSELLDGVPLRLTLIGPGTRR